MPLPWLAARLGRQLEVDDCTESVLPVVGVSPPELGATGNGPLGCGEFVCIYVDQLATPSGSARFGQGSGEGGLVRSGQAAVSLR